MSFVEETYQIIALYSQNELTAVEPGNEAEIALVDQPGPHHQGDASTRSSGRRARARSRSRARCLRRAPIRRCRAGSRSSSTWPTRTASCSSPQAPTGDAAIYTDHVEAIQILRKVLLRVGSITNYLVLKLH